MTTAPLVGNAKPIGLPGGTAGYFMPIRPSLMKLETPGFPLAGEVTAAILAGTATIKYGTMVGEDLYAPGTYRIIDSGAATPSVDHRLKLADAVPGTIAPAWQASGDLSMLSSGSVPVIDGSWYIAETDNLDSTYTAPVAGDVLTVTTAGKLKKGTTSNVAVGEVVRVGGLIAGVPGGTEVLVIQVRFRGTSTQPWLCP